MPIDFRLLSESPFQGTIAAMFQADQMEQQRKQQAQQIASQEAQTVFNAQVQQGENAADRQQKAAFAALDQSNLNRAFTSSEDQRRIENAQKDRSQSAYEAQIAQQTRGQDLREKEFDFQSMLAMAKEAREQQGFDMAKTTQQEQQQLKQQLGQAFQQGGYTAARDVMAGYGLIGDAMELDAKALLQQKIGQDIQNGLLQGQKTIWDIQDRTEQKDTMQLGYAMTQYIQSIAGTKDPELQLKQMENLADILRDKKGIDLGSEIYTPEGQEVFLDTAMRLSNQFIGDIAYKAKDPNSDFRTRQALADALGPNNPYMEDFAKGYEPKEASKGGINITNVVPGTDEEGNVVFPGGTKGQGDIQERLATQQQALRDLTTIKNNVNTDLLGVFGRLETGIARASDQIGTASDSQKARIDAAENLITPVEQFFNQYRKQITGAAASEKELAKLRETFINGDLGPQAFESRLNAIMGRVETELAAATRDASQGGLGTRGNKAGTPERRVVPADASDDEINAALRERGYQ
jgi:hypothetical protein